MVVHWAGEKSNVIVALARDSLALARPKSSDVSIGVTLGVPLCSQDALFSSIEVIVPDKILGNWENLENNIYPFFAEHRVVQAVLQRDPCDVR